MELFNDTRSEISRTGDTNFCVPVALAIVTGVNVNVINRSLVSKGRRKFGQGVYRRDWMNELEDMKVETRDVTDQFSARTVTSAAKRLHPKKKYLIQIKGHLLAFAEGYVQDWTAGRRHRIKKIFEIVDDSIVSTPTAQPVKKTGRDVEAIKAFGETLTAKWADLEYGKRPYYGFKVTGSWVKVVGNNDNYILVRQAKNGSVKVAIVPKQMDEIWEEAEEAFQCKGTESKSYTQWTVSLETAVSQIPKILLG